MGAYIIYLKNQSYYNNNIREPWLVWFSGWSASL